MRTEVLEVPTTTGNARAHVSYPAGAAGLMVLGHGAGGGVETADLRAALKAGLEAGFVVALVEQPYRVAGRSLPPPIANAERAWVQVVGQLRPQVPGGVLVVGGRSFGARVACRSAAEVGASAVLCLAFPLVSPKGADRGSELYSVSVPVLVVQGRKDPFGLPEEGATRRVALVDGTHTLSRELERVEQVIADWLGERVSA
ncbi:alpha/beta hydrolase [Tessaracoccus sp. MC1756]|nr:alpha/beta hydrolase [Tessaracoccus sp. MC1756]